MRRLWLIGFLLGFLFLSSGCALFLVGAGAAGGYAISDDEIEGVLEKKFDPVWKAGRETLLREGLLRVEDRNRGFLEGEVRKSEVKIEVSQITDRTVRLRVRARKTYKLLPDLDLANDLYNKILQKLK